MPNVSLSQLAYAGPKRISPARRLHVAVDRIVQPVAMPALGLALGACFPQAARLALAALPVVAAMLIFCAVATVEPGRTSRAEALRAGSILYVCMLACPAAVSAAMFALGLGPALTCAAIMVAGSPVSMGGGVVAARFGLPSRPVVWAAVMGVAIVPFILPLVAAISRAPGLPTPGALAAAGAIAGLPLLAALGARRLVPGQVDACRKPLRFVLILSLALLACSAGGRAVAALSRPGGWEGCTVALGVQAGTSILAWTIGALFGLARPPSSMAPQLALASAMRNTSVVWAACLAAGGIAPGTEAVVSTFIAATFIAPVVAGGVGRLTALRRRR